MADKSIQGIVFDVLQFPDLACPFAIWQLSRGMRIAITVEKAIDSYFVVFDFQSRILRWSVAKRAEYLN